MVPRAPAFVSIINRRWGGTAVSPEIHRKGLGSSLGSTWFHMVEMTMETGLRELNPLVPALVPLGSTWFHHL